MTKTKVAREAREQHGWEMPTSKLARLLYKDNPLLFNSIDDARDTLRAIEGKHKGGNQRRESYTKVVPDRPMNPYKLPESDARDFVPYEIESTRLLILSDVHLPYQDNAAITAIFDAVKPGDIDGVLLNGDLLDFYGLSRFIRDPKKRSISGELQALAQFYSVLRVNYPVKIFYKFGNHEERYDHFLWSKAAEIADVDEFNLEEVIKRRMPGVEVIKDKRIINFGSLNIIHGHEYASGIFQSVNVARGLFLKSKVSSLQGHAHQVSEHTETDMNGKITTTWSVGCLCDMHPDYAKLNKWSQGFAVAEREGDDFQVKNYRIHKGKIM